MKKAAYISVLDFAVSWLNNELSTINKSWKRNNNEDVAKVTQAIALELVAFRAYDVTCKVYRDAMTLTFPEFYAFIKYRVSSINP